jgi:hypothetical protein
MRRLALPPRLLDFTQQAGLKIDAWFDSVTERFNKQIKAGKPNTSEMPESQWGVWKNSSTGDVYLTINDEGAIKQAKLTETGGPVLSPGGGTVPAATSIDFFDNAADVKRVTIIFNAVSLSGGASVLVQLGTGNTPETTGYSVLGSNINTSGTPVVMTNFTSGFGFPASGAANSITGTLTLTYSNNNTWIGVGQCKLSTNTNLFFSTGSKTLAGTLDTIRITSTGADTFDNGTINILYE